MPAGSATYPGLRALAVLVLLLPAVALGCDFVAPDAGLVTVRRVIDGDTIEIEGGERVRYIGIDTPETVHPSEPAACFGGEASAENVRLVERRKVRLERDTTNRDRYGRLLRYVSVDGRDVGATLVDGGFARAREYKPDTRRAADYAERERAARSAQRGLWGACPG